MTQAVPPRLQTAPMERKVRGPWRMAIAHLGRRKIAVACFLVLALYLLVAGLTYLRLPGEARTIGEIFEDLSTTPLVDDLGIPFVYAPPTFQGPPGDAEAFWKTIDGEPQPAAAFHFLLGTDIQGRSVFWRTLYAARVSVTVALMASILAIVIGTGLGALAGYLGGTVDVLVTWLFTTVASIPRILLVMALAYSLRGVEIDVLWWDGPMSGVLMLILAMGLTSWVGLCRLIRGEIIKQRSMEYEAAARALGFNRARILVKHLLPNVFYLVIIQFSLLFPLFVHLEVILSYLGLGATESVSWGQMINASMLELMRSPKVWWQLVAATVAVFGVSLALNLFGDALRDALDPKLQSIQR